ncbi:hypothetical protein ACO2I3_18020 [Leptospira interrogans]
MIDYWMSLFEVDWISATLIVVICMVGSAIMKAMMPSPALAFVAAPVTLFAAFLATAVWRDHGITLGDEKILDVAVAAGMGMTMGAVATILVYRTVLALGAR